MKDINNEDEYITIDLNNGNVNKTTGKRTARRQAEKKKSTRIGKNKEKTKWSKKKIGITIAVIATILIISLGIAVGRYIYKAEGDVKKGLLNLASDMAVNIVGNDEPIFVLVLGISEDITSKLTDTIILGGYNPETQKAFMVSIPRDTFVGTNEATASGWDKINALYQKDITKTIKAVEERTGINIDKYVVVRNTMLPALVNAVGEVEFDVPINMDYDDPTQDLHIHLKKGVQMINGDEAEQLLRFRHNNDGSSYPTEWGDNDYGRMRTQREFIKVVAKQLISINNVGTLKGIAEAIFANLETNMSITDMIGYIPYAINFNVDDIRMEQLPGSGATLNKLSFYKASYTRSKKLMEELVEYLGLDEKETKKYYTGKIKQTIESPQEDACEHAYTSEIIKESTCEEQGERKYTCSKCKSSYVEEIATIEHEYDEDGLCEMCGLEEEPPEHECKFTKLVYEELPATCISDGEAVYRCEVCKETKNLTIKATGKHTYGTDGKCTTIGCTSVKENAGNNNQGNQGETIPPATCTHDETTETRVEPTCGKDGNIKITCKKCQTTISTETLKATGAHTPGTPVTTAPTCNTAGTETITCTICNTQISKKETAPATGQHSYTNGKCSVCGGTDPNFSQSSTGSSVTDPVAGVVTPVQ